MCKLCEAGLPQNHFRSRRNFLKGLAATGLATLEVSNCSRRVPPRRKAARRSTAARRACATSFAAGPS